MSTSLNVAICQMQSVDDQNTNLNQITTLLKNQNLKELDIISFPENSLFFQLDMSATKSSTVSLKDHSVKHLCKLSNNNDVVMHLGGVPILEDNKIYNATIWIQPGKEPEVVYKKIHLFDVDLKDRSIRESDTFTAGSKPAIVEYKNFKCAQSICYDLRFPSLYEYYAINNADIIFVPAAFFKETGRLHWHKLLQARAIESQAYVVAAAQAGLHKSSTGQMRKTYGHSLIIDPNGCVLAQGSPDAPDFIKATINKSEIQEFRKKIPINQSRKKIEST